MPALYIGLKLLGGLYLCYLGYRIFLNAKQPLTVAGSSGSERKSLSDSFWLGLTTQASNPKAAIVYASVFAGYLLGAVRAHSGWGCIRH